MKTLGCLLVGLLCVLVVLLLGPIYGGALILIGLLLAVLFRKK